MLEWNGPVYSGLFYKGYYMTKNATSFKKGHTRSPKAGRKAGTPNAMTMKLKEGIMKSWEILGGVDYLVAVGADDPKTFCTLLKAVLPAEIKAEFEHTGDMTVIVNTGASNGLPVGIHKSKIIEHESTSH
jgi:hypothetical protein